MTELTKATGGKLTGKVALITGASRGIGRGMALAFAEAGATLVLVARSHEAIWQLADECMALSGAAALPLTADVTDEESVAEVFAQVEKSFGRLDLLVNNAGAFDGGPLDELSVETWDKVIATNLRAPFLCTKAALKIMKRQQEGRIINIGSIAAQRVRAESGPYAASKHALWGLTQVTALEGREYGVTCGCLHPGNIYVERRQESGRAEDEEPMLSVSEISEVALLMATLPPHVEMLEAIVLPSKQKYVGRG